MRYYSGFVTNDLRLVAFKEINFFFPYECNNIKDMVIMFCLQLFSKQQSAQRNFGSHKVRSTTTLACN